MTADNVMLYIEIIEKRTNDLLNVAFYLQEELPEDKEKVTIELPDLNMPHHAVIEELVPTHPCPL